MPAKRQTHVSCPVVKQALIDHGLNPADVMAQERWSGSTLEMIRFAILELIGSGKRNAFEIGRALGRTQQAIDKHWRVAMAERKTGATDPVQKLINRRKLTREEGAALSRFMNIKRAYLASINAPNMPLATITEFVGGAPGDPMDEDQALRLKQLYEDQVWAIRWVVGPSTWRAVNAMASLAYDGNTDHLELVRHALGGLLGSQTHQTDAA